MQKMRPFIALFTAFALSFGAVAADPFSIKTAISAPTPQQECTIPVAVGEVLELPADDLERRMNLAAGQLRGITVVNLPAPGEGALMLEGVEVEPYQFIPRDAMQTLCFVPNEGAVAAGLTLLPQGASSTATRFSIRVLRTANAAPTLEGGSVSTLQNMPVSATVAATDPDGDTLHLQLRRPPAQGTVTLQADRFCYEPYLGAVGSDSFTLYAVDRFGNYSPDALIEINIEQNQSGLFYTDMADHPSAYAAVKLHEVGVFTGEQVGTGYFFYPDRTVTRGELLVMVLAAAGMDSNLAPTVNTQLKNDAQIPLWLKPYIKKALDEGIWNPLRPFQQGQVPTRAEAVQMVALAANITDVKDFTLQMQDAAAIPNWALPHYKSLAAYRMLDLHDGLAHPDDAVSNSYAADLVWQLWKHCHR